MGFGREFASALCAGAWVFDGLRARAIVVLNEAPDWLDSLVLRTLHAFPAVPTRDALARFLSQDRELNEVPGAARLAMRRRLIEEPRMTTQRWPVPSLATIGALAHWLNLTLSDLNWFADPKGLSLTAHQPRLWHYQLTARPKPGGTVRILEAPKQRLKAIHKQVLNGIVSKVAPHPSAHGFRAGYSTRSFVAPHLGKAIVVKVDLEDFFPSVSAAHVTATFSALGYPREVARTLSGLCCSRVPRGFWATLPPPKVASLVAAHWRTGKRLAGAHLPQGAPTSPALATLCAYRLDRRLAAVASAFEVEYGRYADDLVFSGGETLEGRISSLVTLVSRIARDEGFRVSERKTRVMRQNTRQRIVGIVSNVHPNVARTDYDRLKATLHNCLRQGHPSQNRAGHADFRAHLLGNISWVAFLHPARGAKLRHAFDRIDWGAGSGSAQPI